MYPKKYKGYLGIINTNPKNKKQSLLLSFEYFSSHKSLEKSKPQILLTILYFCIYWSKNGLFLKNLKVTFTFFKTCYLVHLQKKTNEQIFKNWCWAPNWTIYHILSIGRIFTVRFRKKFKNDYFGPQKYPIHSILAIIKKCPKNFRMVIFINLLIPDLE